MKKKKDHCHYIYEEGDFHLIPGCYGTAGLGADNCTCNQDVSLSTLELFYKVSIVEGEAVDDIKVPKNDAEFVAYLARKGAEEGSCGRMCQECAFRINSPANKEAHNVKSAIKALSKESAQFNCHPQGSYGNADEICKGFAYAKKYLEKLNLR